MDREELLLMLECQKNRLQGLDHSGASEWTHIDADEILIRTIMLLAEACSDSRLTIVEDIIAEYNSLPKWYA